MLVEKNVSLKSFNTFGIAAKALGLVRIRSVEDAQAFARLSLEQRAAELPPSKRVAPEWDALVLGGGSNMVLTGDVRRPVLKMEIMGKRIVEENEHGWLIEAGAGERWHDLVQWTVEHHMPGLENMALIPGTVGAAPVQNIGAYGVELKDRFHSLDAVDLWTGQRFNLDGAQCAFRYRDSIFKHVPAGAPRVAGLSGSSIAEGAGLQRLSASDLFFGSALNAQSLARPQAIAQGMGLAGRAVITHVRLWLPKQWTPVLDYHDLERCMAQTGVHSPNAQQIFDWVVQVRRDKLPDPQEIGNVGSFFKNPTVTAEQCNDIIAREPRIVHYPMPDGSVKLAAGWMIDACGWKGKSVGHAGVYPKQALVLVNLGKGDSSATGGEVMTLAKAIQTSVYERYGIRLEPEPVVV
ncbi:UDP-N-acetylmuramate dehydrogenase [Lampropedia puyangensis]|uniref:UDP-N-acetylenolpyruvoylglucosamine reductase n=1 Tax=Lampropedia puyangensis TaxID=1330072 RepID=A0A4V4GR46_9BURK|nr:UDP-N-acetylmuramate dehydrogenase [Lampropedia puyangensis]THT99935.1 UDP-N-acetylmuramate dehydrogenase [Lampropedia puyangensis]